jgi:hypothetical protein
LTKSKKTSETGTTSTKRDEISTTTTKVDKLSDLELDEVTGGMRKSGGTGSTGTTFF